MIARIIVQSVLLHFITCTALILSCGLVYGPSVAFRIGIPLNILSVAISTMFFMGWISGMISHQQKIQNDIEIVSQTWSDFRKARAKENERTNAESV